MSIRLEHTDSPTESALQYRREAAELEHGVGFDMVSMRYYDSSSASGFGSKISMTASGYCSSSHVADELYESSDCQVSVHRSRSYYTVQT